VRWPNKPVETSPFLRTLHLGDEKTTCLNSSYDGFPMVFPLKPPYSSSFPIKFFCPQCGKQSYHLGMAYIAHKNGDFG
jgi:hypothetical protein